MSYGDEYQGFRRQPLKGGGAVKAKREPTQIMNNILKKLALPLLTALRAGLKNWITTIVGVCMIVLAVFDGTEVNIDAIIAGIGLIFARDAGKSSQDSGIRPEIIE